MSATEIANARNAGFGVEAERARARFAVDIAASPRSGRTTPGVPPELRSAAPKCPITSGLIHLGVAKEIRTVLTELGVDSDEVIADAGLDPRLFSDAANLVPGSALGRLLLSCVERTSCPHFGLLVGRKAGLRSLRLVGSLMRVSATLGDALRAMVSHLRVQNRIAVVHLETAGDTAVLSYLPYDPSAPAAGLISEGGMATAVMVLRELCGPEWAPSEVLLPRKPPADSEPYGFFFRAPVRFVQERAALVFPAEWLARRLATSDLLMCRALEDLALEAARASPRDITDELRRLLRTELLKGRSSAARIARQLSINRRTLDRHLDAVGTSFRGVADEMRFGIARHLLAETDMSLADVSAALDFSEPAAFTRAFVRWSGLVPSLWRARHGVQGDLVRADCDGPSPRHA